MKDEFQASNISFKKGGKRYAKLICLVKKILTGDIVSFSGVFYNVSLSKIVSKSKQKPYIPFFLGGFSSQGLSKIIKFDAIGWLGAAVGRRDIIQKKTVKIIKSNALEAGKNLDNFRMILSRYLQIVTERLDDNQLDTTPQRQLICGSMDRVGNYIQYLNSFGVDHLITRLTFGQKSEDVDNTMDMAIQFKESDKA